MNIAEKICSGLRKILIFYRMKRVCLFKEIMLGKNIYFGKGVVVANDVSIGKDSYIGQYSYIGPNTNIGNYAIFSDNINIIGADHEFSKIGIPIIHAGRPANQPATKIGDDVWLGHGVTIMRGISIGSGAIIGANSIVTKSVPEGEIWVGSPAKFLKYRFSNSADLEEHLTTLKKNTWALEK